MQSYDLATLSLRDRYALLTRVIAPRPIALVSSLSSRGEGNLAPFSYFMLGGANPPSCAICPTSKRGGERKDTLANIEETGEYVINVCTHALAEQVNRCSFEYPPGVDELERVGLSRLASERVRPPRVAESPIHLECRLHQVLRHGAGPLSSSYVVGEILLVHAREEVIGPDGLPDERRVDFIARLGADNYARIMPEAFFELPRPTRP